MSKIVEVMMLDHAETAVTIKYGISYYGIILTDMCKIVGNFKVF